MQVHVQHKQVGSKGLFYVGKDGSIEAELVYSADLPGRIVIEHTEVNGSLTGQGVGLQLVEAAVMYARKNNLKVVPMCSFAKKVFDKHEEWRDVL
jgi:uncharacterized protein